MSPSTSGGFSDYSLKYNDAIFAIHHRSATISAPPMGRSFCRIGSSTFNCLRQYAIATLAQRNHCHTHTRHSRYAKQTAWPQPSAYSGR